MVAVRIRVHGDGEIERFGERVRRAPRRMNPAFRDALLTAARPAVIDLKRAALTVPMTGFRRPGAKKRFPSHLFPSKGVRRFVSSAIESNANPRSRLPAVEILMREDRIPPRIKTLPYYFTGHRKRLRHPVMGNREVWVNQRDPNMWWRTLKRHMRRFGAGVRRATDELANYIEG